MAGRRRRDDEDDAFGRRARPRLEERPPHGPRPERYEDWVKHGIRAVTREQWRDYILREVPAAMREQRWAARGPVIAARAGRRTASHAETIPGSIARSVPMPLPAVWQRLVDIARERDARMGDRVWSRRAPGAHTPEEIQNLAEEWVHDMADTFKEDNLREAEATHRPANSEDEAVIGNDIVRYVAARPRFSYEFEGDEELGMPLPVLGLASPAVDLSMLRDEDDIIL